VMVEPNTTRGRPQPKRLPRLRSQAPAVRTGYGRGRCRPRPPHRGPPLRRPHPRLRGPLGARCLGRAPQEARAKTTKRPTGVGESNSRPPCGAEQQPVRPSPPRTAGSGAVGTTARFGVPATARPADHRLSRQAFGSRETRRASPSPWSLRRLQNSTAWQATVSKQALPGREPVPPGVSSALGGARTQK
jgi:hypothetical protein